MGKFLVVEHKTAKILFDCNDKREAIQFFRECENPVFLCEDWELPYYNKETGEINTPDDDAR